ncbi:protein of unknown function [Jannaschia faecimaris]|uniref:DUF4864 domain-containing protein n=1 Tax=Jannaschia faecimaris TaxID=1244108 RepID=A0A1H3T027_9RHOB|nr:DUF4864 domain-containing protein [Jannaschia faecimaris]SDZ43105.1 protein of unknown function [Jannaschia faecimaris]
MKGILAAVAIALGAVGSAQADEGAIQRVIGAQIEAFKADDFTTAFTYAAPNIKGMFGTADNFGLMVRRGYPMVWQPGSIEYLGTDSDGAIWMQDVLITDGFGRLHQLKYTMIETPDGWKIAGVQLLEAPEVGA